MSTQECPCKRCTPETGRGPGCHTPDCPNGWYEWDQQHCENRIARSRKKGWECAAENVLIAGATKKKRRKNR